MGDNRTFVYLLKFIGLYFSQVLIHVEFLYIFLEWCMLHISGFYCFSIGGAFFPFMETSRYWVWCHLTRKPINNLQWWLISLLVFRRQLNILVCKLLCCNSAQRKKVGHCVIWSNDGISPLSAQALYVMISCAMVLDNLAITCWFPPTNVNRWLLQAYRNEFDRLEKLDQQTKLDFQKRRWAPQQMCKPQLS